MEEKDFQKYKLDFLQNKIKISSDALKHIEKKIQFAITFGTTMSAANIYIINYLLINEAKAKIVFFGILSVLLPISIIAILIVLLSANIKMNKIFSSENDQIFMDELSLESCELSFLGFLKNTIALDNIINTFNSKIIDEISMERLLMKELVILTYLEKAKNRIYKSSISLFLWSFIISEIIFAILIFNNSPFNLP